jgi:hypothetical protein
MSISPGGISLPSSSQPLAAFHARVKASTKVGNLFVALFFLALGLVPRWVPSVHELMVDVLAPGNASRDKVEAYDKIIWIIFLVLGVAALIGFVRSVVTRAADINGQMTVYPDRLEVERGESGAKVFPFASTPYVRDLKWKSIRHLELADPDTGKKFEGIHPALFSDAREYDQLSAVLQKAHSDFWLGADFPASTSRLQFEFGGKLGAGSSLALSQGTLYYKGQAVPPGGVASYGLPQYVMGLSQDQTTSFAVRFAPELKLGVALLSADTLNHGTSLQRILDAWGVPRK